MDDIVISIIAMLFMATLICSHVWKIISSPFPFIIPKELKRAVVKVNEDLSFSVDPFNGYLISVKDKDGTKLLIYQNRWLFPDGDNFKKEISEKIKKYINDFELKKLRLKTIEEISKQERWKNLSTLKKEESKARKSDIVLE